MSLNGIAQPQYPLTVDGLQIINADAIYLNGQPLTPDAGVYLPLTGGIMTGVIDMNFNKITDVANPVNPLDAVNLQTLTTTTGSFVPYTGAVSNIDLNTKTISSSTAPSTGNNLTNKTYVDTKVAKSGDTMTGTLTLPNLVATSLTTSTPSYTLGIDGGNNVIKYANPAGVFTGSVSATNIPYASATNVLADSALSQLSVTPSWSSPYFYTTTGLFNCTYNYTSGQGAMIGSVGATYMFMTSQGLSLLPNTTYQMTITGMVFNAASGTNPRFEIYATGPTTQLLYSSANNLVTSNTTRTFTLQTTSMTPTSLLFYVYDYLNSSTSPYFYFNTMTVTATTIQTAANIVTTGIINANAGINVSGGDVVVTNKSLIVSNSNAYQTIGLAINNNSGTNKNVQFSVAGNSGSWSSNYGAFGIYNGATAGSAAGFPLVIDTAGNVGLCQPNPSYPLHVQNTLTLPTITTTGLFPSQIVAQTGQLALKMGAYYTGGTGEYCAIQSSEYYTGVEHPQPLNLQPLGGYVGIGTTNPSYPLTISQSSGDVYARIQAVSGGSGYAGILFTEPTTYGHCIRYNAATDQLEFCVQDNTPAFTKRMVINYNGNVGIGTTSPACLLQVAGNTSDYTTGLTQIVNNNVAPKAMLSLLAPSMDGTAGAVLNIGKALASNQAFGIQYNDFAIVTDYSNILFAPYGGSTANLILNAKGQAHVGNNGAGGSTSFLKGPFKFAVSGTDQSLTNGPHIEYFTYTDNYPLFQQLNWTHDNIPVCFDMYYDGQFRNSSSSAGWCIYKIGGGISFRCYAPSSAGNMSTFYNSLELTLGQATFPYRALFQGVYTSTAQPYCQIGGNGGGSLTVGVGGVVFGSSTLVAYQSVGMINTLGSGWESVNGRFWITNDGRWMININFYFNSFVGGTRLQLQRVNSSGSLVESRYCCLVGAGFASDSTYSYSGEMYCYYGDYLRVVVASGTGCTFYYGGMDHSHLTFTFLS